ncbi:MAG: TonB-dependent receptor plug domain-containing protein [Gammaproteobacteria bacterium]
MAQGLTFNWLMLCSVDATLAMFRATVVLLAPAAPPLVPRCSPHPILIWAREPPAPFAPAPSPRFARVSDQLVAATNQEEHVRVASNSGAPPGQRPADWCVLLVALCWSAATLAEADNLTRMSLSELANLEVTTVSKAPDRLRDASASIYVITREDIQRAGATTLPDALRLAPNLLVSQLSSSGYVFAARGLGGNTDAQNFANKLLVLIDGRSTYSPLFSGIYADANDVMLEDVDRIEVISGPGATLWGANAMNGVINVITRKASATQGGLATLHGGNFEQNVAFRYGTQIDEHTSLRFYGKGLRRDETELAEGRPAEDDWYKGQAGFRLDWQRGAHAVTLLGDAYRGVERALDAGKGTLDGSNVLARWVHDTGRNALQVQAYFDRNARAAPGGGLGFALNTYDIEVQNTISGIEGHRLVFGGGQRINDYAIRNSSALSFVPDERTLSITNIFVQDTLALGSAWSLTLGLKLEKYTFAAWQVQPNARLTWQPPDYGTVWLAASRAVRAPTPFDHDVVEILNGQIFLQGNPNFEPETVKTLELGWRGSPHQRVTASVSVYHNWYEDLRSVEPTPGTLIPLFWGNGMQGSSDGIDAWAKVQLTDRWRLTPGVGVIRKHMKFDAGASRLLGTAQAGNDPAAHASLSSSMDLSDTLSFDSHLRYVAAYPDPALPHYYELNAKLAWRPKRYIELSLSGFNLLHADHREYAGPAGENIPRSVLAGIRLVFE